MDGMHGPAARELGQLERLRGYLDPVVDQEGTAVGDEDADRVEHGPCFWLRGEPSGALANVQHGLFEAFDRLHCVFGDHFDA